MKKLAILFVSVLTAGLTFTSCSKDDNNDDSPSLTGKWEYSKMGVSMGGQESLEDYEHGTGCTKDYMQYLNDGSFKDFTYDGEDNCAENLTVGTYTKADNTLTLTFGEEEPLVATVISLTSSKLKLSYDIDTDNGIKGVIEFNKK